MAQALSKTIFVQTKPTNIEQLANPNPDMVSPDPGQPASQIHPANLDSPAEPAQPTEDANTGQHVAEPVLPAADYVDPGQQPTESEPVL